MGRDIYSVIRKVKAKICSDFCEKKDNCEELEINLVGWSRGAVAAVEVADRLDNDGCKCGDKTFKNISVNFVGLFDPVAMVAGWGFRNTIPSNVEFSYALWRYSRYPTYEDLYYPQKRYTNLSLEHDFKYLVFGLLKHGIPAGRSTHGDVGRHKAAFEEYMKPVAIANGVNF